jgi:pSer/pThr/pTyr-binding forkhead associated (FHA) protein
MMATLAQLIDDVVAKQFDLNKTETTLGRKPGSDIQIEDASVSGEHAVIEVKKSSYLDNVQEYFIKDLGSTNGTFVNEQRVLDRQRLLNNDVVRVAWNKFKFIDGAESSLEKTAHMLQE